MGLLDKLRGEFVDIVEWIDDTRHTLVWRFPRYHNQIKNGAQLIVRPGQLAIFVDRGKIADQFGPGNYQLKTANLPVLSTLQGWKHMFDSPFKAEVYFVSTRQVTDLKWGTPNPVMMRDPDFGPVRLRAFGVYTLRATDPKALLTELVGTDGVFEAEEISELMRSMIVSALSEVLARSEVSALDLARGYQAIGESVRKAVVAKVDDEYGLDVPQLSVVNISFPEEVEKALDARTSAGVLGDLGRYQQYQMGTAMTAAAGNPAGGGAADGLGLGLGFAMANQMMRGGPTTPPPLAPAEAWHIAESGKTRGPLSVDEMAALAAGRHITPDTLVWTAGMTQWHPLRQVSRLAQLFPPAPPPPPPV